MFNEVKFIYFLKHEISPEIEPMRVPRAKNRVYLQIYSVGPMGKMRLGPSPNMNTSSVCTTNICCKNIFIIFI